jgi:hypothetical protein
MFKTDVVRLTYSMHIWLHVKAETCVNGGILSRLVSLLLSPLDCLYEPVNQEMSEV